MPFLAHQPGQFGQVNVPRVQVGHGHQCPAHDQGLFDLDLLPDQVGHDLQLLVEPVLGQVAHQVRHIAHLQQHQHSQVSEVLTRPAVATNEVEQPVRLESKAERIVRRTRARRRCVKNSTIWRHLL